MSLLLYINKQLDHIVVEGPRSSKFAAAINATVPHYDRKRRNDIYYISDRWFPLILAFADLYYIHYSCPVRLDDCRTPNVDWEDRYLGYVDGSPGGASRINRNSDRISARAQLFVTADAPTEVVTAAYRALVKIHHPDKGGDLDKFRAIDNAYREILDGY